MQAFGQRHELRRELDDAVVRVGAPEGNAHEHLDELVQHELRVHLSVLLALRALARGAAALLKYLHLRADAARVARLDVGIAGLEGGFDVAGTPPVRRIEQSLR